MSPHGNVLVFETPEELAVAAAERFIECAAKSDGESDRFSVALAGGRTPKRVYELLATDRFNHRVHWSQVHLFFGDERSVPPTHPDSNYAMVYEALISKVAIPAKNVHRVTGESEPHESAMTYETELRTFFAGLAWPRFDLVLLGMGEDGHTASLFPHSAALEEKARWVLATRNEQSDKDGHNRITLTIPAINHAAQIVFLVTGKEKAQRLAEVLRPQPGSASVPAQAIKPVDGTLEWFADAAAASYL
ncbi:MAG TPA: 6-phosphogluconolactonase [Pyrinomonadaceae bacterium]|jgi:6-phosphogluconolactonase|nr:6-phosphogluconolactonase [Pyrinomonadaceae bacterium]